MQSIFLAAVLALGATFPALTSALKDINTMYGS